MCISRRAEDKDVASTYDATQSEKEWDFAVCNNLEEIMLSEMRRKDKCYRVSLISSSKDNHKGGGC